MRKGGPSSDVNDLLLWCWFLLVFYKTLNGDFVVISPIASHSYHLTRVLTDSEFPGFSERGRAEAFPGFQVASNCASTTECNTSTPSPDTLAGS